MYSGTHYISLHSTRVIPISDLVQNHLLYHGQNRKTPCILTKLAFSMQGPAETEIPRMAFNLEYGGTVLDELRSFVPGAEPTELELRPLEQCVVSGLSKWTTLFLRAYPSKNRNEMPYELKMEFTLKIIGITDQLIQEVLEAQTVEKQAALVAKLVMDPDPT